MIRLRIATILIVGMAVFGLGGLFASGPTQSQPIPESQHFTQLEICTAQALGMQLCDLQALRKEGKVNWVKEEKGYRVVVVDGGVILYIGIEDTF